VRQKGNVHAYMLSRTVRLHLVASSIYAGDCVLPGVKEDHGDKAYSSFNWSQSPELPPTF
jgi:hypothetical protein